MLCDTFNMCCTSLLLQRESFCFIFVIFRFLSMHMDSEGSIESLPELLNTLMSVWHHLLHSEYILYNFINELIVSYNKRFPE